MVLGITGANAAKPIILGGDALTAVECYIVRLSYNALIKPPKTKKDQTMLEDGWFREESELWGGQSLSLKVDEVLYSGKTMFQDVLVFKSTDYGNVLVLDGVIQATERDEFAYQEMLCHIPLMSHPNPKRVLIVGGGDGGCVREVLKHPGVERVEMVEIDPTVIELAKKYLPKMSCEFDNPRLDLHICDGFEFLAKNQGKFDVIISDTSDPEGPAEKLFGESYFQKLSDSLTDNGIVAMQASENVWLKLEVLKDLQTRCKKVFPVAEYAAVCVPTYTSGQLGLMLCAKSSSINLKAPVRDCNLEGEVRYYNEAIHSASFVLPTFAKKYINN